MQTDLSKIDNLIFDLGGVVMDLHIDRTIAAFGKLAEVAFAFWRLLQQELV